ncbi:MAG: hypothetical protein V3V08_05380 [Nannocystaceae bacterium]
MNSIHERLEAAKERRRVLQERHESDIATAKVSKAEYELCVASRSQQLLEETQVADRRRRESAENNKLIDKLLCEIRNVPDAPAQGVGDGED